MFKRLKFIQIFSVIILGLSIGAVFFYPQPAQYAYGAGVCPASWYGQEISAQAYEYDPDPADGCRPCHTTGYVKCDNSGNLSYRIITSYSSWKAATGKWSAKMERCVPYNAWPATESRDSGYISLAGNINVGYENYPQMKFLSSSGYSYFSNYKQYCNQTDWTWPRYTANGSLNFNINTGNLIVGNYHRDGSNFTQSVAFVNNPVPPPPPELGTINVLTNNASSSWTIAGPETITGSGTSATYANKPVGAYTIVWNNVAGYITPSTDSQTLANGGTINFTGNYQLISSPPPPPEPTSTPSGKLKEIVPK